jgi:hypothetical protein
MTQGGAKIWYFPDGELPAAAVKGTMEPHEALMIFNLNKKDAKVRLDIYFKDREPAKGVKLSVPGERVVNFRMDQPDEIGGVEIPRGVQYALRVRAKLPVVCQMGRLDATQPNLAYYTTMGWTECECECDCGSGSECGCH